MTESKPLMKEPLVTIIILNYNAGDLLLACIDSIFKSNYKNFEIILVDNASKDNSHRKCQEKFKNIRLIENVTNLGYCEGNNVGIRAAKGEFIVILNPDTIVDSEWLHELILAYDKFGDGLYQPKFLTTTDHNVLMSTGNMIQLFGFGYSRSKGEINKNQFENHELIGYASGTCLFTSSKIINKIGMFDPFLFAYHDDLDLGWRAIMIGLASRYVPKSIVYHPPEGFSFKWTQFKYYLLERNRLYCILTHYSRTTLFKMLPALFLVEIAVSFFYLKKGMPTSKIKASFNIIRNIKRINERYKEIQKFRKLTDKEVIKNFQDEIVVPIAVANKQRNQTFNNFLSYLSKTTRHFI